MSVDAAGAAGVEEHGGTADALVLCHGREQGDAEVFVSAATQSAKPMASAAAHEVPTPEVARTVEDGLDGALAKLAALYQHMYGFKEVAVAEFQRTRQYEAGAHGVLAVAALGGFGEGYQVAVEVLQQGVGVAVQRIHEVAGHQSPQPGFRRQYIGVGI